MGKGKIMNNVGILYYEIMNLKCKKLLLDMILNLKVFRGKMKVILCVFNFKLKLKILWLDKW